MLLPLWDPTLRDFQDERGWPCGGGVEKGFGHVVTKEAAPPRGGWEAMVVGVETAKGVRSAQRRRFSNSRSEMTAHVSRSREDRAKLTLSSSPWPSDQESLMTKVQTPRNNKGSSYLPSERTTPFCIIHTQLILALLKLINSSHEIHYLQRNSAKGAGFGRALPLHVIAKVPSTNSWSKRAGGFPISELRPRPTEGRAQLGN